MRNPLNRSDRRCAVVFSVRSLAPSRKTDSPFLSRFGADRFDEIGAGRPFDARSHETAQHDDREPIGCDKSGTAIGGAKVRVLLQLNDVIEIERADAEVVAMLRGRHDRRNCCGKRWNIDGDAVDGETRLQRYWRFRHVDLLSDDLIEMHSR
jgi:hypothetical protein